MKKLMFYITLVVLTLFFGVHSATVFAQADQSEYQIYAEDFELGVGSEWSNSTTATYEKTTVLGTFNPHPVTLTLAHVPQNVEMTLCFDLWVIDSWDGNSSVHGPDVFEVSLNSGETILSTTFSNTFDDPIQSYPNTYNEEKKIDHPYTKGAKKIGQFNGHFTQFHDSQYEICRTFTNTHDLLQISFAAYLTQNMGNESFGLDNVTLTVSESNLNTEANVVDQIQCVENVSLSPNPADTDIRLTVAGKCADLKGNIYDALGRVMIADILIRETTDVDVSRLPDGTYYLHLDNAVETSIHRFVVR